MEYKVSGILLHPTSLPSVYGIGDLGKEAYDFVDFLYESKQSIWQILPLNPVGYGESPYQPYSAFAANPLLISIDKLIEMGLLPKTVRNNLPNFNKHKIEFSLVKEYKMSILREAYSNFKINSFSENDYFHFKEQNKIWLNNYALFMALKSYFNGEVWNKWNRNIAFRKANALNYYQELLKDDIEFEKFLQFVFYSQWMKLKQYAKSKDIKIMGDMPIFVSLDSSDVWSNPEIFDLDTKGNPNFVAGVPPDYFSETGQLWGNPLYDWQAMENTQYFWWRQRFKFLLKLVDIIRVDHFRGFEAFWKIPANEKTAKKGKWVKGPGEKFFSTIELDLGKLPIVAEDLGYITPDVHRLKKKFKYPGMKILQFACEGGLAELKKALSEKNLALYTGTHDNDTLLGWYKRILKQRPDITPLINSIIKNSTYSENICWSFIELAFKSKAKIVIVPLQDILCLDNRARMNFPGTVGDNWNWRFTKDQISEIIINRLSNLTQMYDRDG